MLIVEFFSTVVVVVFYINFFFLMGEEKIDIIDIILIINKLTFNNRHKNDIKMS